MARPRTRAAGSVVRAARDVFWELGFEATSIGELESRTGVNRSSLYHGFGSKRELFGEALRDYIEQVTEPMLAGVRSEGAGLAAVAEFFAERARAFRDDPERAARGCLLINAMAEFGAYDEAMSREAAVHRSRLYQAFAVPLDRAAVRGEVAAGLVAGRVSMLVSATLGVFLTARTDPHAAAVTCDSIAGEIRSWRLREGS